MLFFKKKTVSIEGIAFIVQRYTVIILNEFTDS